MIDAPPTVAGSHMSLLRPAPSRARMKNGTRKTGNVCDDIHPFLSRYSD